LDYKNGLTPTLSRKFYGPETRVTGVRRHR
jgi:hypothetical protein